MKETTGTCGNCEWSRRLYDLFLLCRCASGAKTVQPSDRACMYWRAKTTAPGEPRSPEVKQ